MVNRVGWLRAWWLVAVIGATDVCSVLGTDMTVHSSCLRCLQTFIREQTADTFYVSTAVTEC